MLFSMFLPLATAFADLVPEKKSNTELTFKKAHSPACVVMVIVKGEKFVPFICIIDSHRRLLKEEFVNKVNRLNWWQCHTHNYLYKSLGGGLPVNI